MGSRILGLFAVLSVCSASWAQQDPLYSVPIEWQKVQLQRQIAEDLTRSIQTVVEPSKFLVNVVLQITRPRTIGGGDMFNTKGAGSFPLSKLGINSQSAAFKNAITQGENNIFSRLGMIEVDVALDSSVTRSQENLVRSFVENGVKAYTSSALNMKLTRLTFINNDDVERVRNLEVARVNVEAAKSLADGLSDALKKGNDQIAQALNSGNDKIANALLTVADSNAKKPVSTNAIDAHREVDKNALPKSWQEILVLFKIPLAMLVATLLLIAFVSGFKNIENKKVALMATTAAVQQQASAARSVEAAEVRRIDSAESTVAGKVAVDASPILAGGSDGGFDQFKKMAEQYAETAAFLVKTWVNMDTPDSREALSALTKMVPVDVLVPVVAQLDENLKGKLRKASAVPLDAGSIQRADAFIVDQMVDNFLVNIIAMPDELKVILSGMTMDELVECIQKDIQYGICFMNVLQTPQVARMLSALPDSTVQQLFDEGVTFSAEKIRFLAQNLATVLGEIRQKTQRSRVPLVDKSLELMKILGPERETKVLDMLVNAGDHEMLVEAVHRFFPVELIMGLPPEKLRIILNKLPAKQRARLIYSRSAADQKIFFTAIGAQGRLREIIDSEIGEIKNDKKAQAQIKKDQSKIWEMFIASARQTIRTDESLNDLAKEMLNGWLQKKGVAASGGTTYQAA